MSIDEAMAKEKEESKRLRKIIETGYDGEISIEAMFCDDTDAIKEAYERFENCAKRHEQYAEWLEELKMLRELKDEHRKIGNIEGFNQGYRKAIDDLSNKICMHFADWKYSEDDKCIKDIIELASESVEEIAEQLKAGERDENS